jgi:hypothetical protein
MLRTYKYILKLHHVENEEYSIINILSLVQVIQYYQVILVQDIQ